MAEPVEELVVELDARIADIEGKIRRSLQGAEREAARGEARISSVFRRAGNSINVLGQQAAQAGVILGALFAVAGAGFVAFGTKAVMASAQMETTAIAFKSLLGSAEAAKTFIAEIQDFAAKTPFEFVGLTQAARTFMAFGVDASKIIPIMQTLGDAVGKVGGSSQAIAAITRAFTQMMSTGRLNAQDMMQLANAGIQAWPMLAQAMGVSVMEVRAMAEKGLISGVDAVQTLLEGMQATSQGQMQNMAGTFSQLMSNLQDVSDQTMIVIGDAIERTFGLKGKLGGMIDGLTELQTKLKGARDLGEVFESLIPPNITKNIHLIAGGIVGALTPAFLMLGFAIAPMVVALGVFALLGAGVVELGRRLFGSWEGFTNILGYTAYNLEKLIDYFSVVMATGDTANQHLGLMNGYLQGIAQNIGGIVNIIKDDFLPEVRYLTDRVRALTEEFFSAKSAILAVTFLLFLLKASAIGAAGLSGIGFLIARVGALVAVLGQLKYAVQFLFTFRLAVLGLVAPTTALGLAIGGVGAVVAGLATNFGGMRDTAVDVLAILAYKFLDFAEFAINSFDPVVAILRIFPEVGKQIGDAFDSARKGVVDLRNAAQSGDERGFDAAVKQLGIGEEAGKDAGENFLDAFKAEIDLIKDQMGTGQTLADWLEDQAVDKKMKAYSDDVEGYIEKFEGMGLKAVDVSGAIPGAGEGKTAAEAIKDTRTEAEKFNDAVTAMGDKAPKFLSDMAAGAVESEEKFSLFRESMKQLVAEGSLLEAAQQYLALGMTGTETYNDLIALQKELVEEERKAAEERERVRQREREEERRRQKEYAAAATQQFLADMRYRAQLEYAAGQEKARFEAESEVRRYDAARSMEDRKHEAMLGAERRFQEELKAIREIPGDMESKIRAAVERARFLGESVRDAVLEQISPLARALFDEAPDSPTDQDDPASDRIYAQRYARWNEMREAAITFFARQGLNIGSLQRLVGGIPSYATGGLVGGSVGMPSLAVVHGQERVLSYDDNQAILERLDALISVSAAGHVIEVDRKKVGGVVSAEVMGSATDRARMGGGSF